MLTRTDHEDLNMLINITKSMYRDFQKLCDMEIKGQKENEEFINTIEEIKRDIVLKNSSFDRITDTPERCLEVAEYLKKGPFKNSCFSNAPSTAFIVAMNNLEDDDIVLGHILNQISKKILGNTKYMVATQGQMLSLPSEIIASGESLYAFQNTLQTFLMTDMYNLLLSLNERRINSSSNQTIKNSSIKTKYQLGFLIPDLMNELINQKFVSPLSPFLINATASKMYSSPEGFESLIKEEFLINQARKCLNMLHLYCDEDLINPETMAYVLNIQDMYRAILILSDSKTERSIVEEIKKYLVIISESEEIHNKKLVQKIFEDILALREKDKIIPQIISFGRI